MKARSGRGPAVPPGDAPVPAARFRDLPALARTRGRREAFEALRDRLFEATELPLDKQVRLILDVDRHCLAIELTEGRLRRGGGAAEWSQFRAWLTAEGDAPDPLALEGDRHDAREAAEDGESFSDVADAPAASPGREV